MKRGTLTRNAKAFMEANSRKPVVMGSVTGPHGGCTYTLKGGQSFTLTAAECRAVGAVNWYMPPQPDKVPE